MSDDDLSLGDKPFVRLEHVIAFHWRHQIPIGQEMALLKRPIKHKKTLFKAENIDIMQQLGEGNFGKVFKVLIKSENRYCAMKTTNAQVNREAREMFKRLSICCYTICLYRIGLKFE